MTLNKHSIVALAAACSMTLGGVAFAQDSSHPGMAPQDRNPSTPSAAQSDTHGNEGSYNTVNQSQQSMRDKAMGDHNMNDMHDMHGMHNGAEATIVKQLREWKSTPDKAPDAMFALEAGCGNMWEVEFGKLVADKAQDQQVKDAANQIVKDHQAAQQKLEPIAQKLGVQLPNELPAEKQAKLDIYRQLPADKLENTYLSQMRADHLKDVNVYSDEAKSAQDPDLKNYASETLPKLREHAAMLIKTAETRGMNTDLNFQHSTMAQ
ncbi:MAG: DUF4142 domain-containing protein [Tepidisphaeraceae bacterium]